MRQYLNVTARREHLQPFRYYRQVTNWRRASRLLSSSSSRALRGLRSLSGESTKEFGNPLYYFWRQSIAVAIGLCFAFVCLKIPIRLWEKLSVCLLIISIFLLAIILIPGVGKEVNGSVRWISLGPFALQVSELIKLSVIVYLAGYLVRHRDTVRTDFAGFIRPVFVLTLIACLLLLEPDFGTSVILFATVLGMLFMGGVPLIRFFVWVLITISILATLIILSPYRMQRLTSFVDPWQDPFNNSFQLTQALIAFGRGEWFGVGLGGSVQKLFYLPEAHTDFIFAVFAEECGLIGSLTLLLLYSFIIWRAFVIGYIAENVGKRFAAFFAYGVGFIIGIQACFSIGVNMGVLPTKGLTLPLMSYGGNSMVIYCILLGILLRIEYETRRSPCSTFSEEERVYA